MKLFLVNILNDLHNESKKKPILKSVNFEITNRCNLQCSHCYMDSTIEKEEALNYEEIRKFILDIKKNFGNTVTFSISGGEPLVRQDIFDILKLLKEEGFTSSIATNGILLDKDSIDKVKKYIQAISISIDGLEDEHNTLRNSNSFNKIIKNINEINKYKDIYLTIKTVVNKNNVKKLEDIYSLIENLNVKNWHLIPIEPIGRAASKHDILSRDEYLYLCDFIDKKRKVSKINIYFEEQPIELKSIKCEEWKNYKRCYTGINSFSILYDGSIVSCINCDRKKMKIYGNIKKDNINDIWKKKFRDNRCKDYKFCSNHYYLNKY